MRLRSKCRSFLNWISQEPWAASRLLLFYIWQRPRVWALPLLYNVILSKLFFPHLHQFPNLYRRGQHWLILITVPRRVENLLVANMCWMMWAPWCIEGLHTRDIEVGASLHKWKHLKSCSAGCLNPGETTAGTTKVTWKCIPLLPAPAPRQKPSALSPPSFAKLLLCMLCKSSQYTRCFLL
jgi:hypothetical protein